MAVNDYINAVVNIINKFEKSTDGQKLECYKSYCDDVRYQYGDRVKPMSYDEWCRRSVDITTVKG